MDVLPFDDYAGDEATDSVSDDSGNHVSPSVCYRHLGRDLEVQGYGKHHLDTILAITH